MSNRKPALAAVPTRAAAMPRPEATLRAASTPTETLRVVRAMLDQLNPAEVAEGDLVDFGAQLRMIARRAEDIDRATKERLAPLFGPPIDNGGHYTTLLGDLFRADMQIIVVGRIDIPKLREQHPRIAKALTNEAAERRITYRPR